MMNKLIAYNLDELTKKLSLAKAKEWRKSEVLTEAQWKSIKDRYSTELFSPNVVIRILLFIVSLFGLSMSLGVFSLIFSGFYDAFADNFLIAVRVSVFIYGLLLLYFGETLFFKEKKHYKSGITEAIVYVAYSFIYFGVLGESQPNELAYYFLGVIFLSFITIRYHDIIPLLGAIGCFVLFLFSTFNSILSLIPFVMIVSFGALFVASQFVQKKVNQLIWEDHFILLDSLALLMVYLGGNYFVVRELSVSMMGLELAAGEDIPFAFLFYGFTVLIPIGYMVWAIVKKSILFIRVSLITLTLTAFTLKYYFSLGHPEITVTIAGAVLISVAITLMMYLKTNRKGFTRNQIITSKWDNAEMSSFIASQTLGGHQINESDGFAGKGGEFGGGGASGSF